MADDDRYPVSWVVVRSITACCNFLAAVSSLFAFQALIRNPSIRKNSYNIYVIFLILPDAIQNVFAASWNVFPQGYPLGFFEINCFVWLFYFLSNFSLNMIVAYEINNLLTASHRRQKTSPPKVGRAWKQVGGVYLFAASGSLWAVLPYKWSPMDIDDGPNGSVSYGSPKDGVFGPTFAFALNLGGVLFAVGYVVCIRIRIAWLKLLPMRGRTRVLSLFFMRIIIVFLLFYLPNAVLNVFLHSATSKTSFWVTSVISPLLNAAPAFVTLYMILSKDDIRTAIADAWNDSFGRCCCRIVERRPSATPAGSTTIRPWDHSNVNGPSASPRPQVGNSTDSMLPIKKSEWDEEDVYPERSSSDSSEPTRPELESPEMDGASKPASKQEESKVQLIDESASC